MVGALVLIALAVIVIPLLLDFRKDYGHVIKGTNIPPKPDDFRVEVVPIKPPPELQDQPPEEATEERVAEEPSTAGSGEMTNKEAPAAAKPALKKPPAEAVKTPEAAKHETARQGQAATDEEAWVVQLGSFSNKENADDLRRRLQAKGYKSFIDAVSVDGKSIHRVRIGPLDNKAEAAAVRDKVAIDMKLNARVFSYP
jgi:DedD protein